MKDLTAIITTFNRPKSLLKLIKSIRKYYNDLPIIVVDNGNHANKKIKVKGVSYYKVPFDAGLSYSRNFAISKVKTDYIVLLDDDFEFVAKTRIDNLLKIAKDNDFDIVGGSVEGLSYNGILELDGNILRYIKGDRGTINDYPLYDMVLNFFVGKVKSIKKNDCWDEELKLGEHTDFFLRAKEHNLKITFEPSVSVKHNHDRGEEYSKFRSRANHYVQMFMRKNGISKIINFVGNETLLKSPLSTNKNNDLYSNIAFCIKTLKRPQCLEKLLWSILSYYPEANILVADDDIKFNPKYYKELWEKLMKNGMINKPVAYSMPFDSGLSKARNYLVDLTDKDYILLLEDDFVFIDETKIMKMKMILDSDKDIGIVGGSVMNEDGTYSFDFNFEKRGSNLYQRKTKDKFDKIMGIKYKTCDCVFNFALIKKEVFQSVKWDEDIKIMGEHTDFFLRLKETNWKVAYCPEVKIGHEHISTGEYRIMRKREEFFIKMMKKHGLKKYVYLTGRVYELEGDRLINYKQEKPLEIKI